MANGNIHPTRIFKAPEELWKAFEEYKVYLKTEAENWPKVQYVGKDGERKVDYPVLPYTLEGFEGFCYDNYGCASQYFDNKDQLYSDFVVICQRIKREIRAQQITGGLLGAYNASITQRLNGLTEKQDINVSGDVKAIIDWSDDEGK